MVNTTNITLYLIIWFVATVFMISFRLRKKMIGTGLVFGYLLALWTLHWLAASLYVMPWYAYGWNTKWYPGFIPQWIESGFKQSTYAIVAFSLGSVFLPDLLMRILSHLRRDPSERIPDPRLPKAYLLGGILFYGVLSPSFGRIPTLSGIVSGGVSLMLVGICLSLWRAEQEKKRGMFFAWFMGPLIGFPLLTILFQGFLSFAAVALLVVFSFIASFLRPRWKIIFFGILLWYMGLSFFVTYMRDRDLIREVVWKKEPMLSRINQLAVSIGQFEWLNLKDEQHLRRIDMRLNQNLLVGASIEKLSDKVVDYARGSTIWNSLFAFVPRILWPNKPVRSGGNAIVGTYTGIAYAPESGSEGGTTIGVGQVMEFYVNFGTMGVIVGFLFLSGIIGVFDGMAKKYLVRGDWQRFTFWFLSGLSFLQAEGSFADIFLRIGSAMVMAVLVNTVFQRFRGRRIFLQRETLR